MTNELVVLCGRVVIQHKIIVFITRIMKTVEYKLFVNYNNYKSDPLHYLLNVTLAIDCNIAKRG